MSKRLEAMRANPKAGWTIADVKAVCAELGVVCEPPPRGGSHHKVAHPSQSKPVSIRALVRFIDQIRQSL